MIRLEASLKAAGDGPSWPSSTTRPSTPGYRCPEIIAKLEAYGVKDCFYGTSTAPPHRRAIEGTVGTVGYHLVSAEYLRFVPKKILE